MRSTAPVSLDRWKVLALGIGMFAGLCLLVWSLYREQIVRHSEYARRHERQSIRRVRLPGVRGRIFDRKGVRLAENRPSYCVAVYVEELRRPGPWRNTISAVDELIDRLADVLELPREYSLSEIEAHVSRRLPMPLLAWQDIDERALARLAERGDRFPGVDIYVQPVRRYPLGTLAAHVIGYTGRDRPAYHQDEPFDFYVPDIRGRAGVERFYDRHLAGVPGGELMRVDAHGYKHEVWSGREPVPGSDLVLTIDTRVQETAEQAMRDKRGAVVVLDVRNGDVLALASMPAPDPNALSPAPSTAYWRSLMEDPQRPLINRAISGLYPPGSVFKPVVALAAVENAGISPDTIYDCRGQYLVGGSLPMHCWRRSGHGPLALRKALEQSCNVYFFHMALDAGYERIYHHAQALGFGFVTGIDLDGELGGLMPGPQWKRETRNERWWVGDTCNVAIGQGALQVTPVQMAVFAMSLANGGIIYRPRLRAAESSPGEAINRMSWSANTLEAVRAGMYDAVQEQRGTGHRAHVEGWELAGKTGTAQYGPPGRQRLHAWMIAYGPFQNARYAVAVVIEDADSGGLDAAPIVRTMMETLKRVERQDGLSGRGPAPAADGASA